MWGLLSELWGQPGLLPPSCTSLLPPICHHNVLLLCYYQDHLAGFQQTNVQACHHDPMHCCGLLHLLGSIQHHSHHQDLLQTPNLLYGGKPVHSLHRLSYHRILTLLYESVALYDPSDVQKTPLESFVLQEFREDGERDCSWKEQHFPAQYSAHDPKLCCNFVTQSRFWLCFLFFVFFGLWLYYLSIFKWTNVNQL